jgi:hypothetical protein
MEENEEIEVEPRPLVSTNQAAKMCHVARRTFPVIAADQGIEPIRTARRQLWRKSDVDRLISGGPARKNP